MKTLFRAEPVAVFAALQALVTAVLAFVAGVSPERLAAINALIVAVGAMFARSKVAPILPTPPPPSG